MLKFNKTISDSTHLFGLFLNFVFLILFFYYHDHGFDLTDDAFYALSATQHDNIIIGLSFGYLTSYLMGLFSCDFHDTRIIGYILLLGSTILMTCSCIYKYSKELSCRKLLTAVSISTPCIIFYSYGIYSLSYNSYSVFGINFILTGLFLNKNSKIFSLPSLFSGLGMFLLGMSKFTIIPVFFVTVLIMYFFYKNKNDLKILLNGAIISIFLLLLHFLFSNDTIELFVKRLILTNETLCLLKSNHIEQFSIFFVLSNLKDYIFKAEIIIIIIYCICPFYLLLCLKDLNNKFYLVFTVTSMLVISYPILNSLKKWVWHIDYVFLFYFTQFILTCVFIKFSKYEFHKFYKLLYLLLAPIVYGIGSNDGISFGGYLTLFWSNIAIFVMFISTKTLKPLFFRLLSCYTILLAIVSAFYGFKHPYRVDGRISQQSSYVTTIDGKHEMIIGSELCRFVTKLQQEAQNNGWESNTPLIELTNSPGLTFLLSGRIVSTPWFLASYDGSEKWSLRMLEIYNQDDLPSAWLLTSNQKTLSISTSILNDVGLNFPTNYNEIKIGNYNGSIYSLWKPSA